MTDLLLGHSLGTSPFVWSAVIPLLDRSVESIAFPLPGHAGAPRAAGEPSVAALADGVVALADAQGIDTFYYGGVSIGGAIGLELALRHPDRVEGVAIVCAIPTFGEPEAWRARAEQVRRQGTPSLIDDSARRWFHPDFAERDPDAVGRILHNLSDTDDESYAWLCEALADYDVTAQLGEITVPVRVMQGDHDPVATVAAGEAMVAAIPGAKLDVIAGCGHQAPIERPERVAVGLAALMGSAS